MRMRQGFRVATFSAGLITSACQGGGGSGSGGTGGLPCANGQCPLGYMCFAGYCVPLDESETGDDGTYGYGTVAIEVVPVDGDSSIIAATTEVNININYRDCVRDFYLGDDDLNQDGQYGMPVFDAFVDKLCSDYDGIVNCTVKEMRQNLIVANDLYSLGITYQIQDSASLVGNEIRVGPLPTTALAGCPAQIELRQSGAIGKNNVGEQIWKISTLPASNIAETDQATPLRIEVAPP
jgi:hypothetical protein